MARRMACPTFAKAISGERQASSGKVVSLKGLALLRDLKGAFRLARKPTRPQDCVVQIGAIMSARRVPGYEPADDGNRLFFVGGGAETEAQAHPPQANSRNLEVAVPEFPLRYGLKCCRAHAASVSFWSA
jgi:hypothetical protein